MLCPDRRSPTMVDQMGRSTRPRAGIIQHGMGTEISKRAARWCAGSVRFAEMREGLPQPH
jgi:hypothetical protein